MSKIDGFGVQTNSNESGEDNGGGKWPWIPMIIMSILGFVWLYSEIALHNAAKEAMSK